MAQQRRSGFSARSTRMCFPGCSNECLICHALLPNGINRLRRAFPLRAALAQGKDTALVALAVAAERHVAAAGLQVYCRRWRGGASNGMTHLACPAVPWAMKECGQMAAGTHDDPCPLVHGPPGQRMPKPSLSPPPGTAPGSLASG